MRAPRARALAGIALRLLGLGAAAWSLVATSAPPCETPTTPVAFHVDEGCGRAGIIVVDQKDFVIEVHNAELFSLGPVFGTGATPLTGRSTCGAKLTDGGWSLAVPRETGAVVTCTTTRREDHLELACTFTNGSCLARLRPLGERD
jgi:hypothetical protein